MRTIQQYNLWASEQFLRVDAKIIGTLQLKYVCMLPFHIWWRLDQIFTRRCKPFVFGKIQDGSWMTWLESTISVGLIFIQLGKKNSCWCMEPVKMRAEHYWVWIYGNVKFPVLEQKCQQYHFILRFFFETFILFECRDWMYRVFFHLFNICRNIQHYCRKSNFNHKYIFRESTSAPKHIEFSSALKTASPPVVLRTFTGLCWNVEPHILEWTVSEVRVFMNNMLIIASIVQIRSEHLTTALKQLCSRQSGDVISFLYCFSLL